MNWKNMLVTLSVALNVGLVVYLAVAPSIPTAFAQNRTVQAGGYTATTADVSSTRQALYIIDNREKRMNVYVFNPGKRGLKPVQSIDLRGPKVFGAALAGDVKILPGRISSTTEAVYVIDPVGKKMVVFASKGRKVELVGIAALAKDFSTR